MLDILSPDGFSIWPGKTYKNINQAKYWFYKWRGRFKAQGYYSYKMERIPLEDLADECQLIEL